MSLEKKRIRSEFRDAVFERDKGFCRICGKVAVDPHHIMNRNLFPNGGYVAENGIALCIDCHEKAEKWDGNDEQYSPGRLYEIIGSSLVDALTADTALGEKG